MLTVNPSIVGGDNGEVITAAVQLGTVHPPGEIYHNRLRIGYPLITMIGHLVWLPFKWTGRPALVLNILGIVFECIAAFFICSCIFYLTNGDKVASLFSTCWHCIFPPT